MRMCFGVFLPASDVKGDIEEVADVFAPWGPFLSLCQINLYIPYLNPPGFPRGSATIKSSMIDTSYKAV